MGAAGELFSNVSGLIKKFAKSEVGATIISHAGLGIAGSAAYSAVTGSSSYISNAALFAGAALTGRDRFGKSVLKLGGLTTGMTVGTAGGLAAGIGIAAGLRAITPEGEGFWPTVGQLGASGIKLSAATSLVSSSLMPGATLSKGLAKGLTQVIRRFSDREGMAALKLIPQKELEKGAQLGMWALLDPSLMTDIVTHLPKGMGDVAAKKLGGTGILQNAWGKLKAAWGTGRLVMKGPARGGTIYRMIERFGGKEAAEAGIASGAELVKQIPLPVRMGMGGISASLVLSNIPFAMATQEAMRGGTLGRLAAASLGSPAANRLVMDFGQLEKLRSLGLNDPSLWFSMLGKGGGKAAKKLGNQFFGKVVEQAALDVGIAGRTATRIRDKALEGAAKLGKAKPFKSIMSTPETKQVIRDLMSGKMPSQDTIQKVIGNVKGPWADINREDVMKQAGQKLLGAFGGLIKSGKGPQILKETAQDIWPAMQKIYGKLGIKTKLPKDIPSAIEFFRSGQYLDVMNHPFIKRVTPEIGALLKGEFSGKRAAAKAILGKAFPEGSDPAARAGINLMLRGAGKAWFKEPQAPEVMTSVFRGMMDADISRSSGGQYVKAALNDIVTGAPVGAAGAIAMGLPFYGLGRGWDALFSSEEARKHRPKKKKRPVPAKGVRQKRNQGYGGGEAMKPHAAYGFPGGREQNFVRGSELLGNRMLLDIETTGLRTNEAVIQGAYGLYSGKGHKPKVFEYAIEPHIVQGYMNVPSDTVLGEQYLREMASGRMRTERLAEDVRAYADPLMPKSMLDDVLAHNKKLRQIHPRQFVNSALANMQGRNVWVQNLAFESRMLAPHIDEAAWEKLIKERAQLAPTEKMYLHYMKPEGVHRAVGNAFNKKTPGAWREVYGAIRKELTTPRTAGQKNMIKVFDMLDMERAVFGMAHDAKDFMGKRLLTTNDFFTGTAQDSWSQIVKGARELHLAGDDVKSADEMLRWYSDVAEDLYQNRPVSKEAGRFFKTLGENQSALAQHNLQKELSRKMLYEEFGGKQKFRFVDPAAELETYKATMTQMNATGDVVETTVAREYKPKIQGGVTFDEYLELRRKNTSLEGEVFDDIARKVTSKRTNKKALAEMAAGSQLVIKPGEKIAPVVEAKGVTLWNQVKNWTSKNKKVAAGAAVIGIGLAAAALLAGETDAHVYERAHFQPRLPPVPPGGPFHQMDSNLDERPPLRLQGIGRPPAFEASSVGDFASRNRDGFYSGNAHLVQSLGKRGDTTVGPSQLRHEPQKYSRAFPVAANMIPVTH